MRFNSQYALENPVTDLHGVAYKKGGSDEDIWLKSYIIKDESHFQVQTLQANSLYRII